MAISFVRKPPPTPKPKTQEYLKNRRNVILDDMLSLGSVAGSAFTRDNELEDLYQTWIRAGRPANSSVHFVLEDGKHKIEIATWQAR